MDAVALKDARPRQLTQAIAAWIYETTDLDGVTFASRHGDDLRLWAIFERPGDPYVSPKLRHARPEELHHDSDAIKDAFQMLGLTWRSEWPRSPSLVALVDRMTFIDSSMVVNAVMAGDCWH